MRGADLPPEAFAAGLAGLGDMTTARLRALLEVVEGDHAAAWHRLVSGEVVARDLGSRCSARALGKVVRQALGTDLHRLWGRCVASGVGVAAFGSPGYPGVLAADLAPPAVVFWRGEPDLLVGPSVAIVGTRTCSRYGLDLARDWAAQLAAAGVGVVSGLALGVDGAAHRGALDAGAGPVVGVVGTGLDRVYPPQHRELWGEVGRSGVLVSEAGLGAGPEPWRFPERNRIIAALADVVLVVESGVRGGSLITAREAMARGRPVLAVPGSVHSPASQGTNRLLADGCTPACDVADVLVALGLTTESVHEHRETRPAPDEVGAEVLSAIGWQPANVDAVVGAAGHGVATWMAAIERLEHQGWVESRHGWVTRRGR